MSKLKVGFIGLGNIGKPMARNLVCDAMEAWVCDINPAAVAELVELGAHAAATAGELARHCGLIGICVRDENDVNAVMEGEQGILANAAPGTVVAIHSTVSPAYVKALAERVLPQGVHVIDAPITGGASGAQSRTLCYMVGGEAEVVERLRPMLETSAKRIVHAGGTGMGMSLKLCNNVITYAEFIAIYEAMRLARAAGLDPELLKTVGTENGNITEQMKMFLMLHEFRPLMSAEQFDQAAGGFTAVALKDLSVALNLAGQSGTAMPGAQHSLELIEKVYRDAY